MTLIDSSVWIDFLRGTNTPEADFLDSLLGHQPVAIGDLVVTEVLQGLTSDTEFQSVLRSFASLDFVVIGSHKVAIQAARNYRYLRAKGVTVRKTIDTLIATRCIEDGLSLLYSDRDFDPFVAHLGLLSAGR